MKCSNCSNAAAYIYQPTESQSIPYCIPCMPAFLRPRMKAGHLPKADGFDDYLQETIAALAPKDADQVESPKEESKPVKKSSKKAVAVEPDAE